MPLFSRNQLAFSRVTLDTITKNFVIAGGLGNIVKDESMREDDEKI